MKKISLIISTVLLAMVFIFISDNSFAQVKSHKKKKSNYKKENGPPPWAPAHGYRAKTRYVYFTEQNFYYDNNRGVYLYLSGSNWQVSASIPNPFKNVDLTAAVKIDLDFDADDPQKYNSEHRKKYKKN